MTQKVEQGCIVAYYIMHYSVSTFRSIYFITPRLLYVNCTTYYSYIYILVGGVSKLHDPTEDEFTKVLTERLRSAKQMYRNHLNKRRQRRRRSQSRRGIRSSSRRRSRSQSLRE